MNEVVSEVKFIINGVKDLVEFVELLATKTEDFLKNKETRLEDYEKLTLIFNSDITLNERAIKIISNKLTYFKGEIVGKDHTIRTSSLFGGQLFSSLYNCTVSNLHIENTSESRGLKLATHMIDTDINNCTVTGSVTISTSYGSFALRAYSTIFNKCIVKMNTKTFRDLVRIEDAESGEAVCAGGFVAYASKNTTFNDCEVSGNFNSEVGVGGFVGISKNVVFNRCDIYDLKITAMREGGGFVGRGEGDIVLNNCDIIEATIDSAIYGGIIVGKSFKDIELNEVGISLGILSSDSVSSFTGTITGQASSINICNSDISSKIVSNFCIAGISPDCKEVNIKKSKIACSITSLGYYPMESLTNEVTMTNYRSSFGEMAKVNITEDSNLNIVINDLSSGGHVNPFEEDY